MNVCPRCYNAVSGPGTCRRCSLVVPAEWLTNTQLSLAITGARTSGKSVMIGVMMDQFEYFLSQRDSFLTPLGNTKERFQRKYRDPLLQQRNLLGATPPSSAETVEPLLWDFTFQDRRYCLAVTDAAGEDFESLQPTNPTFRYLGFVDLIVSLIDPLKVKGIAAVLGDSVTLPPQDTKDIDVLRQVLRARDAHRAQGGPNQALAVVLSKFDVLQQLKSYRVGRWQSIFNRPGSAMQRDPSMVDGYQNELDGGLLHEELCGMLELMDAQMIRVAASESNIPMRFFAVSALGAEPDAQAVGSGGIIPFRILDILQAVLAKKGRELHVQ